MQNLVEVLNDRGLDFLDRAGKANEILVDDKYLYPGKIQMLFDWLSGSLLKIGKFDDTIQSSKVHVYGGAAVWDLFHKLLKHQFVGEATFLSQPQIVDRRLLKLNSPVLIIMSQFFRNVSKMDSSLVECNLENVCSILRLCREDYSDQLGQNPMHFSGLLEGSIEALDHCSAQAMEGCVLEVIKLFFTFIQRQSNKKKAVSMFYEKFFPLVGQILKFFEASPSFENSVEASFKVFFFENESLADLGAILNAYYVHNRFSLLKDWSTVSAGVETSSGFYQQLPEQILCHGQFSGLLSFLFKLIVEKSSEAADRTLIFNLMTVVVVSLTKQSTISFSSVCAVLKQLLGCNMYQHRNDDTYIFQTDFLRYLLKQVILPNLGANEDAWSVLSVLTELNFYLVSEHFEGICGKICSGKKVQAFIVCFLGLSISARQLGDYLPQLVKINVVDVLVDSNGNVPGELCALLRKVSGPLTMEAIGGLSSVVKEQFSSNAYFLASLFLQYSSFPDHYEALAKICCLEFDHYKSSDASVERFLLCFFNRARKGLEAFSEVKTGICSVDALLAHRLGMASAVDEMGAGELVRFIPVLKNPSATKAKELFDLVVGEYVLEGCSRYTSLLCNANFYESDLVKGHFVSYLVSSFPKLAAHPKRFLQIVCALPSEIFSNENSQILFDSISVLECGDDSNSLKIRAMLAMSANPMIKVVPSLIASSHELLSREDPKLVGRLVGSSLKKYGVSSFLQAYKLGGKFSEHLYLKPLFSQASLEAVDEVEAFGVFCGEIAGLTNGFSEPELDLIDSLIGASSHFKFDSVLEDLFAKLFAALKDYDDQMIPGNLLICLSKIIRSKDNLLPPSKHLEFLALCSSQDMKNPCDAYEKAIIIMLESMPFEMFQGTLKEFAAMLASQTSSTELKCRVIGYISRLLNSSDKVRARLCFELGSWALGEERFTGSKLALCHKLVISKSLRPINSVELGHILQICYEHLDGGKDFEAVCGILLVLQQSYWPLVKTMMPTYISLFQRILECQTTEDDSSNVQLFVRLLSDFGSHSGLAFHLTPLILQYVTLVSNGSLTGQTLKTIEKALLPLLKHLESPKPPANDDPAQLNAIDNFGRLLLVCQQSDQKTIVKRMVEDYRKEYKYTGKA